MWLIVIRVIFDQRIFKKSEFRSLEPLVYPLFFNLVRLVTKTTVAAHQNFFKFWHLAKTLKISMARGTQFRLLPSFQRLYL